MTEAIVVPAVAGLWGFLVGLLVSQGRVEALERDLRGIREEVERMLQKARSK